ncbi:nuclear transport factor 2 family protein [Parafrankia sp. EUN1f]|uniref:nuclear transport factor 2 family protein n=1 Tax=Parafrankia sp. EUN1f TaxID=102897 RepID=UPI0001C43AAE|nr:nuclear transport factor 2 family protein [Parafrankia sp. EUN1f]EFC83474.1 hypothetical protein FrEUN1fDRAFT_3373 [Parafrankia sp. EUN1f]
MSNVSSEVYTGIAAVVARYADYCDHGRWADAADLFTEDGVFDAGEIFGEVVSGRAALTEFMSTRPKALAHHPTTFYVDAMDGSEYSVRMKMLVVFDGAISSIDYYWVVVPEGHEFQIKRQEIAMVGRLKTRPAAQPAA